MAGTHPAVLLFGRFAQCRLQAGAGRYQPVPGRLQQPVAGNAAAGSAGSDGGNREILSGCQESAADSGKPHPQHLLPAKRRAADANFPPDRPERAPRFAVAGCDGADPHRAARRHHADAGAARAHPEWPPRRPEEFRPLHGLAQQRPVVGHSADPGKPARAESAAAAARRLGGAPQEQSLCRLR